MHFSSSSSSSDMQVGKSALLFIPASILLVVFDKTAFAFEFFSDHLKRLEVCVSLFYVINTGSIRPGS